MAFGAFFALAVTLGDAAAAVPAFPYATPVFGLASSPDGSILVADAGAGIVQLDLRRGVATLIAELPGVADIAPLGRGDMFAVTGIGEGELAQKLFRVSNGQVSEIADLFAFEEAFNPDGGDPATGGIDSNPFEVVALSGGRALVADAGGNDLLIVDARGHVDWVASLPMELVSTENALALLGCPDPPEGVPPEFCELPPIMPAQPVATSVAIGPDGAYYVGELKGFPAPVGESQIWRIEPGTRHAACGTSPACSVVADGFTSIVDLAFGPDGTLYVTEIDEASFLAVELVGLGFPPGILLGGTVNACDPDSWTCVVLASGLPIPIATTVASGTVYVAIWSLVPGMAEVIPIE